MQALEEKRIETRTDLNWPVSVWMPQANRFFNAQSCNISKSGAYLKVPLTMPIEQGQIVEMNFPRTTALAVEKGSYSRIKSATVVRVERRNMLEDTSLGLAVKFA